jgi:excisionase family DNA binding protein
MAVTLSHTLYDGLECAQIITAALDLSPVILFSLLNWPVWGSVRSDSGVEERRVVEVGEEALDLLTVKEVAKRLRVSEVTVRRLIKAEEDEPGTGLESLRIGTARRVAPEAIVAYKDRLRGQGRKPAA